ncbi:hypothetical protein, partial [Agrobacterium pusense]|uniref:hypothetical protein n=1 Tax=Agrobacterium pusense TaxID=648995 RepID=UPI0028AC9C12
VGDRPGKTHRVAVLAMEHSMSLPARRASLSRPMTLTAFVLTLCSTAELRYGTRRTASADTGATSLRENE